MLRKGVVGVVAREKLKERARARKAREASNLRVLMTCATLATCASSIEGISLDH